MMTPGIDEAVRKAGWWDGRVRELLTSVCGKGLGEVHSDVRDVVIPENWPVDRTEIRFTRCADGQQFRAYLIGNKFKVRPIRKAKKAARFGVVCMECGRKFQTNSTTPSCPKCNSSDIDLQ